MSGSDSERQARQQRRAWIREHHPDRGSDPAAFTEGLARLGSTPPGRPSTEVRRTRKIRRRIKRWRRDLTALIRHNKRTSHRRVS